MRIDRHGVEFCAGWESFVPWPYDDKAKSVVTTWHGIRIKAPPRWTPGTPVRGTLTAGFGHTDKAKHPLKIADLVQSGRELSKDEAYQILDVDLDEVEATINRLVKVPVSQSQFDAMCSLVLNMGGGNFKKSSLLVRLNKGDYAGARAAFDLYVNSGGQRLDGLVRRRDAEQALWDERRAEAATPNAEEEFEETPKELDRPVASRGALQTRTIKGTIAAAGSAALPTAGAVMQATGDAPAPTTVTETITHVVDRAGTVVDTIKSAQEILPEPPKGIGQAIAHLLTDPFVVALFGVVALGALAFIAYERWRKLHQEGV